MGSGAWAGCVAGWCSPVAGPVGGVVMVGVLAHHLEVVGGRMGRQAWRVSAGKVAVLCSTKRLCARRLRPITPATATGTVASPGG